MYACAVKKIWLPHRVKKHSRQPACRLVYRVLDLIETSAAYVLALEFGELVVTAAEVAVRVVLDKDDLVAVNVYLDRIRAADFHLGSYLLRDNDSAKLVDVSNYTS